MILPPPDLDQTPDQAEAFLDRLLMERQHGLVSDDELRSLLPRLRWRDSNGGRYTLGINTRSWYAWDGGGWAPAAPATSLRLDLDPEPQPIVDTTTPLEEVASQTAAAPLEWAPTHGVPPEGLPAWAAPDPASVSTPLGPGLPVQVAERWGDWSRIVCSNGWTGWVDGRLLVPYA